MLLIIHIPKTAGTSLRIALMNKFGPSRLAYDYWGESEVTSDIIRQHLYDRDAKGDTQTLIEELRSRNCLAIVGHYPLSKYGNFFDSDKVIAFVREPLVRSCSEYLHKINNGKFVGSFTEFMETPVNINIQARLLEGQDDRMLIGITERYKESLALIRHRCGIKIRNRRENRGAKGGGARLAKSLDRQIVDQFYMLNHQDVSLYEECLARLESELSMLDQDRGFFKRLWKI